MNVTKFKYRDDPGVEEAGFYREHGYLYVEGFYDRETEVEPVRRDIYELLGLIGESHKIELNRGLYNGDAFDEGLQQLVRDHRPVVGVLYDAVKKLPNYLRLACAEKNDRYCRAILGSSFVGFANRGYGIRMDNPNEDQYSTQLHQDYVSQLSSQNATVLWSPLRDVTPALGPMTIYPGSHKSGVFPIVKKASGSRGLVVKDEDEIAARYPHITPDVAVGDCVFLDFLTLHESGRNKSDKTRWSMLSRYFDFGHPSGRAIDWKGGLQDGTSFEVVHPEWTEIAAN
jgi:hypothetical protein